MDKGIIDKIQALASQVVGELGIELVDVALSGSGRKILLRVTIDREGGIMLEDCALFSRRFESLIDVEDPLAGSYTLEVSSPGLDRPLNTVADFKKNIGKLVRIITKAKIDNQSFFAGRLKDILDNTIIISANKKGCKDIDISIPIDNLSRANLEIDIEKEIKGQRPFGGKQD